MVVHPEGWPIRTYCRYVARGSNVFSRWEGKVMDFSIPDEPDTDVLWDSAGNEWQRKVYITKKVWMCIQPGVVRSMLWVELLRNFGPLTDTPPVPNV